MAVMISNAIGALLSIALCEQIVEASSPNNENYVTWTDFWIVTGILIGFVFLLLLATIFLLWVHFCRGGTSVPLLANKPEIIRNDYAPPVESISMGQVLHIEGIVTDSNDDESSFSSPGDLNEIRTKCSSTSGNGMTEKPPVPGPRGQTYTDDSYPPTPEIPPRSNFPTKSFPSALQAELHSAVSTIKGPAMPQNPAPQTLQDRISHPADAFAPFPETKYRDRTDTDDSDEGYDNDLQEPESPAPHLPSRNPKPKRQTEESSYYEMPNEIVQGDIEDENMYSDVIPEEQNNTNEETYDDVI